MEDIYCALASSYCDFSLLALPAVLKIPLLLSFVNSELLRENKRMLDKPIREIERERQNLQTQEKKLIAEIKKTAKQGQMVRHSGYKSTVL
jgi:hypothetical protein